MAEYIEREKVVEYKNYGKGAISDGINELDPVDDIVLLEKGVNMIPTADVVEVVRCGECKHYNTPRLKFCGLHAIYVHEDDFCSYGKRKGGAE